MPALYNLEVHLVTGYVGALSEQAIRTKDQLIANRDAGIVGADLIAGKLHLQICHSGQVVGAYLLAGLDRQRLLEITHFGLVVDIAHDAEASLSLLLRGGQVGSTSGAIQHHTHADLQIDGGINVANVLHVLVVTNRLSLHCFSSLS